MKKLLLVVLASCGSHSAAPALPTEAPPVIHDTPKPPTDSPPPTDDVALRKHAFSRLPSEMTWDGNKVVLADDLRLMKFQEGGGFDVTEGPAVVVKGTVTNEMAKPVAYWNQHAHRLMCAKGSDCIVAVHAGIKADSIDKLVGDLQWKQLDPARRDPLVVPLWGDGSTGPNGFLMKMKPGGGSFWHIHRNNYSGVVLSGTVISYESGKEPRDMPPGSYWWQPGGYNHTTDCKGPGDCVIYLDFTGAFDVKPVP